MNILMIHNRYQLAGGEDRSAEADVTLLRDHGHRAEFLERDNRDISRGGSARAAVGTIWASDSYRRIASALRGGSFDVLHVHNFFPLWSPSVYYAADRHGVPVVQTLHNYRLACVNSLCFRDSRVCDDCLGRAVPWQGVVHACYRNSRPASAVVAGMITIHRLVRTWERKVQVYVAVSERARVRHIAGGLRAEQVVVRPNFLHPSPPTGDGGGGYALFVGRLSEGKGVGTLLDAWHAADRPLPLKIIGEGPLQARVAAACEANAGIEWLGARTLPEVLAAMRRAECLIFPSDAPEAMGRTVMEALAVGTPVVVARPSAAADMITPGQTGWPFPVGDVAALRERAEWCARNVPAMRAMRRDARAAFEARYTGAPAAASLLAIYRTAQAARGHRISS